MKTSSRFALLIFASCGGASLITELAHAERFLTIAKGVKSTYSWIDEAFFGGRATERSLLGGRSVGRAEEELAARFGPRYMKQLYPHVEDTDLRSVVARVAADQKELESSFSNETVTELGARFPKLREYWGARGPSVAKALKASDPLTDDVSLFLFQNQPQNYASLVSKAFSPPNLTLGAFRQHVQGLVNRQLDRDIATIEKFLASQRTAGTSSFWPQPAPTAARRVQEFLDSLPSSEIARSKAAFPVLNKWAVEQDSLRVVLQLGDVTAERIYNLANFVPAAIGTATGGSLALRLVKGSISGPDVNWAGADPCARAADGSDRRIVGRTNGDCEVDVDSFIRARADEAIRARARIGPSAGKALPKDSWRVLPPVDAVK